MGFQILNNETTTVEDVHGGVVNPFDPTPWSQVTNVPRPLYGL